MASGDRQTEQSRFCAKSRFVKSKKVVFDADFRFVKLNKAVLTPNLDSANRTRLFLRKISFNQIEQGLFFRYFPFRKMEFGELGVRN